MLYPLTEEEKMIKDIARKIAKEKIVPVRAKFDETEDFPWEVVRVMADADLFRVFIPEEYEGLGMGVFAMCLAVEELSWGCAGIALSYAATALGTFPILLYGNEEQKKKYLPKIASGKIAAFCITEPQAGSDILNIKTRAERNGDFYVLNGLKQFITNGGEADIYTVIALTDPRKGIRGGKCFYSGERHV